MNVGALVLAVKNVINEFDKKNQHDNFFLKAREQQCISIAKWNSWYFTS